MPPNRGNSLEQAMNELNVDLTYAQAVPSVPDKAPNKEDGKVYHSYTDLHHASLGMVPSIRVFQPDVILAVDDGCVPAMIVCNELAVDRQVTMLNIRVNNAVEQWLDDGSASVVQGARVVLVTLMDAGRKQLQKIVNETMRRYSPARIAVAVPYCKDKPKQGVLSDDIDLIVGSGSIRVVNTEHCFPWDTSSWEMTIEEHNKKAERCTSVAAFKKKRDEKLAKKEAERLSAMSRLMSTENPEMEIEDNDKDDLPNLHNDLLGADAIMRHLMEDAAKERAL